MAERTTHELFRAFNRWGYDEKGYAPYTRYEYYLIVLRAEAWLRQHRNRSLVYADAKDLKAFLFSTMPSARNRNHIRSALVAAFEFFEAQGLSRINYAKTLPRLPEPRGIPKPIEHEEAMKLIGLVETLPNRMWEAMIKTFLYTGMRKMELRALERSHVSGDWIHMYGKGNKERSIKVHPELRRALDKWLIENPSAKWVFPSPRDPEKQISESALNRKVHALGEAIGIARLHPHRFRHTAATRMLERGADLRTVQVFLGHSSPQTTAVYTKVRNPRLAEAIDRLDFKPQKLDE